MPELLSTFLYRLFLIVFFTTNYFPVLSQNFFSISGYVTDSASGETLPGASITVKELNRGATTNMYGFFSISLPEGTHTLVLEYVGYGKNEITILLNQDLRKSFLLHQSVYEQQEVVVTAKDETINVRSPEMGKIEVDVEKSKKLPVLFGEVDLLKTLQLLPGVQSAGEGSTGIYIRGGGPDQNLVLLDEAPVFNTGHLFGFFSVFNSDAIKSLTLYKGYMPAKYGGRLSSVLDFTMKEGNNKKFQVKGGIGLIASRISVEGPIIKNKSSFLIAIRRTYIDQLTKPLFSRNGIRGLPYYFYDINMKVNYSFSERNKIFLSSYIGRDDIKLNLLDGRLDSKTFWGNNTLSLRWNHLLNRKTFINTSFIWNNYVFNATARFDNFATQVNSKIEDLTLKSEVDHFTIIRHTIKYGIIATMHTFVPRRTDASASAIDFTTGKNTNKSAYEAGVFISDDFKVSDQIELNTGIRLNFFQQVGPYEFYDYTTNAGISYRKGDPVIHYLNPEPRVGLRISVNDANSIKTAFNYNNQYIHLVSISGNSLPFDIWIPTTKKVKPQQGWQYSLGYFKNLFSNALEFSVEGYYKELNNLIEYRESFVPTLAGDPENDFVFGRGKSYGIEFLLRKNKGKFQGWIGYTLAKADRYFPDINNGKSFPARYDRRHDLSIVGLYELGSRWTIGCTFVYASGQPITIPERRYFIEGVIYNEYSQRNGFRMEDYHRLDVSATYEKKKATKFQSSWTFAIYNIYNRKNPYLYFIDAQGDASRGRLNISAKKLYLFPVLPSVTWNFKFL